MSRKRADQPAGLAHRVGCGGFRAAASTALCPPSRLRNHMETESHARVVKGCGRGGTDGKEAEVARGCMAAGGYAHSQR